MPEHLLGPHVVGQRVVIRYRLRDQNGSDQHGPSGGSLLTDVLGVCTSWGPVVALSKADGTTIMVNSSDIVSGKPVPPRESIRLRVSSLEAEQRALAIWPELSVTGLGDWLLRSGEEVNGRLPARANSVFAWGDPGVEFDEAEAFVIDHYAALGRPAWAQVEVGSDAHLALAERGWVTARQGEADSVFQLASLPRVLRALNHVGPSQTGPSQTGPGQTGPGQTELRVVIDDYEAPLPQGLPSPGNSSRVVHHAFASLGENLVVASGKATVSGDWVGLHDLWTDRAQRGRGHMRQLLAEVLDWAGSLGATTAYLQTIADNEPALRLYEAAGFVTHHSYRYLAAPRRGS